MTTALQTISDFTPEQVRLITDTIAKNATAEELQLFLYRCNKLGLDPLKPGKIHFVKYGGGPGSIVIGIEGFRQFAHRSKLLSGIKRGTIKDEKGKLLGAWAEVYRKDWTHPARAEVSLVEYDTNKAMWAKMKETMIQKCAEVAALRMAFSDDMGGVYIPEELDKQSQRIEPPSEGDGADERKEYVVPYGPCAKQYISDCDPVKLRDFIIESEAKYAKSGRAKAAWFLELVKEAEPLIADFENQSDNIVEDKKEEEKEQDTFANFK